jgi:mRNA-degrading endonuclease RelE of RelBE toxin-antitoxin system
MMRFVETPAFTAALRRHLDDEQYRALQVSLLLRPEQRALIPGGRGLRKLRWRAEGRGKRGGVRVIYYWAPADDNCLMVYLYAKNEEGDLTREQLRLLARVAREEFE